MLGILINGGDCDGATLNGTCSDCETVTTVINEIAEDITGDSNGDGPKWLRMNLLNFTIQDLQILI